MRTYSSGILLLLILSVRWFLFYPLQRYSYAKYLHIFSLDLRQWFSSYINLEVVCQNYWRETNGKTCINFAQPYVRNKKITNKQINGHWTPLHCTYTSNLKRLECKCGGFEPLGILYFIMLALCLCIFTQRNGVIWSVENRRFIAFTVRKM